MATFLNIGLAVCVTGLLAWNLRLARRALVQQMTIDLLAEEIVQGWVSEFYEVDGLGQVANDPIEPNPKAIH